MAQLRRSARNAPKEAPAAKKAKAEPISDSEQTEKPTKTEELQVGDKIPDVTLLDENEEEVNLADVAKKTKYVVIFAYPKASTPGCTRQVCGFQKNYSQLQELNTAVFGLSSDTPKSQLNFVTKQELKYPLLSDPSKKLIGPLGAKKSPSGVKRSHWIFVDGVLAIKKILISPEVSVNSALEDIQKFEAENGKEVKAENGAEDEAKNDKEEEAENGENGVEKNTGDEEPEKNGKDEKPENGEEKEPAELAEKKED